MLGGKRRGQARGVLTAVDQMPRSEVALAMGLGGTRQSPQAIRRLLASPRATLAVAAHASLIFSINNNIEQMEWSFNYS